FDATSHWMALGQREPCVRNYLFDTERDAFVLNINPEHHGVNFVALLVEFGRMLHLFGPVEVRDVHQAIDAFFDLDKHTEVGDTLNLPVNARTDGMISPHLLPRVRPHLLESERDTPVFGADFQDYHLNLLSHRQEFGRMRNPFRPGQLRDVEQSFHAFFQLDKGTIVSQAHNLSLNVATDRITLCDSTPGVRHELFHTE